MPLLIDVGRVSRHPLTLLVAGAVLSAGLGGFLTERWQDQEQALAVKRELVERMATASATLVAAVQAHEFHPDFETRTRFAAHFLEWDAESQAIEGQLATYLPSATREKWTRLSQVLLSYYNLADRPGWKEPTLRKATLAEVAAYAGLSSTFEEQLAARPRAGAETSEVVGYQNAWRALKSRILLRRNAIIDAVLESSIRTS